MSIKKFNNFAIGWMKSRTNKNGQPEDYISAVPVQSNAKMNQLGVTLIAKFENGEEKQITNFLMNFNGNKKSEKAPDVQFFFVTEE